MSTTPGTYACDACTFVQSIYQPNCEMCGEFNPNFEWNLEGARLPEFLNLPVEDEVVQCFQCDYINIGSRIRICAGCGKNPTDTIDLANNFPMSNHYAVNNNSNNKSTYKNDRGSNEIIRGNNAEKSQENSTPEKQSFAAEKGLSDDQLVPYYNQYILILRDQQQKKQSFTNEYLNDCMQELFQSLDYKYDQPTGQLTSSCCQICCEEDKPMVTMKTCGHCVACVQDFNEYLSQRIESGDIVPWIPCLADSCTVPCHVENIIENGGLTYSELVSFITQFMLKKLSRNENFITCTQCEKGGFLQMGPPKKQTVICLICNEKQTIEKGTNGELDINFKKMIETGELRECPTCKHLTLKEKGICNVIQCAKCGIWWNWNTREQGHSGSYLKQVARINGTLWEPGELEYQRNLEANNLEEFKALLERNGIKYNPNYIRGDWDENEFE